MKDRPTGKKKVVLVAEDDAQDRCLLRYAVAAASSPLSFHFVDDGAKSISYLKGEGHTPIGNSVPIQTLLCWM